MNTAIVREDEYEQTMENVVENYLKVRETELWYERDMGKKIHCMRYLADSPRGVVMISHGFTESAEKYKEVIYYFLKERYHVYLPEYCGHGYSYRLNEGFDAPMHVDCYERYVKDFLHVAMMAKGEHPDLPMYLYGHSMGGGLGAAEASWAPELFSKVILSSPMIAPSTGKIPWIVTKCVVWIGCFKGKSEFFAPGQSAYQKGELFEDSCSLSRPRFDYYLKKKEEDPHLQMGGASYAWLREAMRLHSFLMGMGWKRITAPVLVFQADEDYLVSKKEQVRFVAKMARRKKEAKLVKVPGSKHEIYNSRDHVAESYWRKVFAFLER